ncbi:MAG: DUF2007 domain-containing protein [Thermoleophilia bacterium]|nr:DUF2007 domain-containing protein [Thermoleophilia bacterium]
MIPSEPEAADYVLLARYPSELDAELARSVLKCEDIPSVIFRDDAGGMAPPIQLTMGVRLLVPRTDLERAREILEASKNGT